VKVPEIGTNSAKNPSPENAFVKTIAPTRAFITNQTLAFLQQIYTLPSENAVCWLQLGLSYYPSSLQI
jgi:hypothetical protein